VTDMVSSAVTRMTHFVGSLRGSYSAGSWLSSGSLWPTMDPNGFLVHASRAMLYIYPTISPLRGMLVS
jgi:hypothetical protein